MNQRLALRLGAATLLITLLISESAFAEKTVARKDLPAAVEKTVAPGRRSRPRRSPATASSAMSL
jgi:hypothetical protein